MAISEASRTEFRLRKKRAFVAVENISPRLSVSGGENHLGTTLFASATNRSKKKRKLNDGYLSADFQLKKKHVIPVRRGRKRPADFEDGIIPSVTIPSLPSNAKRLKVVDLQPTFQDIPAYLLADIFDCVASLQRPKYRRVCRGWNSLLCTLSLQGNRNCVMEFDKWTGGTVGYKEREQRCHHFRLVAEQVVTSSTRTLYLVFPQREERKELVRPGFDLWYEIERCLKARTRVDRVVLINTYIPDVLFLSYSPLTWQRSVHVTLINAAFKMGLLLGNMYLGLDGYVVHLNKASFTFTPDRWENDRALMSALEPFVWPFQDRAQLDWVIKCAPLLRDSSRDQLVNYLNKRRLYQGEEIGTQNFWNINVCKFLVEITVDPSWNWMAEIPRMDGIKLAMIAHYIVKDSKTNADIPLPPHPFDQKSVVWAKRQF